MAYELYLPPERNGNGRFAKGRTPHNKGIKWDEYMSPEAQKRASKGWRNLSTCRPKTRPDNAGKCRIPIIGIDDNGKVRRFASIAEASEIIHGESANIRRCIRLNTLGTITKAGRLNTDHKYKGFRFYSEDDIHWKRKASK